MGDQAVTHISNTETRSKFIRHLLNDVKALEHMLDNNLIESDITRIGAEQEFCLVNNNWRPAKTADDILKELEDPHFTTELARFNLEINLDPFLFAKDAFSKMERQLMNLLKQAKQVAKKHKSKVILTGILPTISKNELHLDYMTQSPRYWMLNEMAKGVKGSDFELHIMGVEELSIQHDSVLFEACNTSFQMHLQVAPDDFIQNFNWAQAISAPVLGVSTNSPLLLGRDLWNETRIALFQQSIDTRRSSFALKDQQARVTFGMDWAKGSIVEIFKDDIANFNVWLEREITEDSLAVLASGKLPKLQALNMNNSTIYRWNRPCYGSNGDNAHIRIENRYIPSGPSAIDEVANMAFWTGLMIGRPKKYDDMPNAMDFREAKSNFVKTARNGKQTVLNWMGDYVSVRELVLNDLLPIAYEGLRKQKIDTEDIERLLKIIEKRAVAKTGAHWQMENYRRLRKTMKKDDALILLTENMHKNQKKNTPVHEWLAIEDKNWTGDSSTQVQHIMTTQLFTVKESDLATLAAAIMVWKNIHHVPVENKNGDLTGILTWKHMENKKAQGLMHDDTLVGDIMTREVVSVRTDTEISKAIQMMKKMEVGCVPVVSNGHMVGLITVNDVLDFDRKYSE